MFSIEFVLHTVYIEVGCLAGGFIECVLNRICSACNHLPCRWLYRNVLPIECALHIIHIEIGCFAGRRGRGQVCPAAHGGLWNQGRFSQGPRGVVECVLYSLCSLSLALLHKGLDVHRGLVTHTQMHSHARTLDSLSLSFSLSLSLSRARARSPPPCLAFSLHLSPSSL